MDDATREARRTAVHARLKRLGTLVGSMLEHGAADEVDEAAMSMSTDSLMVPLLSLVGAGRQLPIRLKQDVSTLVMSVPPLPESVKSVKFAQVREELLVGLRGS